MEELRSYRYFSLRELYELGMKYDSIWMCLEFRGEWSGRL